MGTPRRTLRLYLQRLRRTLAAALAVRRGLAPLALGAVTLFLPVVTRSHEAGQYTLAAAASLAEASPGQQVTYTVTLTNATASDGNGLTLRYTLPPGFSYVPYSAQVRENGVLVSTTDPEVEGANLTWRGLSAPARRASPVYGMHTFVQDRCTQDEVDRQLADVLLVAGTGAYVKQLFHLADYNKLPEDCWVYFVNRCYDLGLVPVVRLATWIGDGNWVKPQPPYSADHPIVQAFRQIVAGLPRRDGHRLYIEIWNEPNLDLEWSGRADPEEYADFLVVTAAALRGLNDPRIVLLNGGLSPGVGLSPYGGIEPDAFIDRMVAHNPAVLEAFDVWAAHTYPGNRPPEENYRDGTVSGYRWLAIDSYQLELARLAHHGRKGVSVLVTEAGYALGASGGHWPAIDEYNRADYMRRAYRDYWSRWPELLGVTPFLLYDPLYPAGRRQWEAWFWQDGNRAPRPQFQAVQALDKSSPPLRPGELTVSFRATAAGWAGDYAGSVQVSGDGPGTLTHNGAAAVRVNGPTPPTSGETVCREYVLNGSFEQDAEWAFYTPNALAVYSTDQQRTGARSARIGLVKPQTSGTVYSSARQYVTIPENATSVRLSFWYWARSARAQRGRQYVWLMQDGVGRLENALWVNSDAQAWRKVEFEIRGHAGQTVYLHLGALYDGADDPSGMYVDDVSLTICTAGQPVMPPPTATPIATPAPGEAITTWLPLTARQAQAGLAAPGDEHGVAGVGDAAVLAADCAEATPTPTPAAPPLPPADSRLLAAHADGVLVATGERLELRGAGLRPQASLSLGATIGALALDEDAGAVYAALPERGEVAVVALGVGGRPLHETARLTGLGRPVDVAAGPAGSLLVADGAGRRLVLASPEDGTVLGVAVLPAVPGALAVDGARDLVLATQLDRATLLALDAASLARVAEVDVGGVGLVGQVVIDPARGRAYVAYELTPKYGAVAAIDLETWRVTAHVAGNLTQPLRGARSLVLSSDGGVLYVGHAGGVSRLAADDLRLLPGDPLPAAGALAAAPEGGVYLATVGEGLLHRQAPEPAP